MRHLPREPLDDKEVLNAAEAAILSSHIRLGCPRGNRSHCERRKIWEGSLRTHPVEMLCVRRTPMGPKVLAISTKKPARRLSCGPPSGGFNSTLNTCNLAVACFGTVSIRLISRENPRDLIFADACPRRCQ